MRHIRPFAVAAFCVLLAATAACSREQLDQAVDKTVDTTKDAAIAVEKDVKAAGEAVATQAKAVGDKTAAAADEASKDLPARAVDTTKEVAAKVADKTVEVATVTAEKAKELAEAAAEVVNDAWITAKLKAKFADDVTLDGAAINVDTKDFVVTLKGTVPSIAAKAKAQTIATDTRGVKKVVNELVVK